MTVDWSVPLARGFCVFPLLPKSKIPAVAWDRFKLGERATPAELADWQARGWQPGIPTNQANGLVVFDIDTWAGWALAHENGLPDTFTVKSPNGWHYYFQHPGWAVSNRAGAKFEGVKQVGWDIRGDRGYVAGPGCYFEPTPAERAAGKVAGAYVIEMDAPVAPLPAWLVDLLTPVVHTATAPLRVAETTSPWGVVALHESLKELRDAPAGTVNDTLNYAAFRVAQAVAGGEITEDDGREGLLGALRDRGIDHEPNTLDTMHRGWEAGIVLPRAGPQPLTAEAAFGVRADEVPDPPAPVDLTVRVPLPPKPLGPPKTDSKLIGVGAADFYFAGCAYVMADDAVWIPEGWMLKKSAFDALYGGPEFYLSAENGKPTKSAWEMFRLNDTVRPPIAHRTFFRPELAPGKIFDFEGMPHLNAYVPVNTQRVQGDASRFVRHVHTLLPNGNDAELLLHWMASCVQNPGKKFQWWPVIQGAPGNGKTLLLTCMAHSVGSRYTHLVNPEAMQRTGNQFNAWIENKLFLGFEEIHTGEGQQHFTEMMKSTVTNKRIVSEGKGTAQSTVDNRANGMMLTNHPGAVPVNDSERRYAIFWCAQQSVEDVLRDGLSNHYFLDMFNWLENHDGYAIITDYLASYPLRAELDPAREMTRAPVTTSTAGAIAESLGNVELEVLEAVTQEQYGFCGGFISSDALKPLMDRMRIGRKVWKNVLDRLGYVLHPALGPDGRVRSKLADGRRPRLYVTKDHPSARMSPGEVGVAFEAAQRDAPPPSNVVAFPRPA